MCCCALLGNGEIDFEEFIQMMAKKMRESDSAEEIREAFKVFDKDGDGYLNAKELKQVRAVTSCAVCDDRVDENYSETQNRHKNNRIFIA